MNQISCDAQTAAAKGHFLSQCILEGQMPSDPCTFHCFQQDIHMGKQLLTMEQSM